MATTTKSPRTRGTKQSTTTITDKAQLAKELSKLRHGDSLTVSSSTLRVTAISMSEAWRLGGYNDVKVVTRKNEDGTFGVTRVR